MDFSQGETLIKWNLKKRISFTENCKHIEDWGFHENYIWIYVHSNDLSPIRVVLANAIQQDCGFQMIEMLQSNKA